jgi:hypothetical protein
MDEDLKKKALDFWGDLTYMDVCDQRQAVQSLDMDYDERMEMLERFRKTFK